MARTQRDHGSLQRFVKMYRKYQEDTGNSIRFRGMDLEQLNPSTDELLGLLHEALNMLAAERESHDFSLELLSR